MADSTSTMEAIIQECLSIYPTKKMITIFKIIYPNVQRIQMNQKQLHALAYCIADLLIALDRENCRGGRSLKGRHESLCSLLNEISVFAQREANRDFVKLLMTREDRIARIDEYHYKLVALAKSFRMSSPFNQSEWQSRINEARKIDEKRLHEKLETLEADPEQLTDILRLQDINSAALRVYLQRQLDNRPNGSRERQFISHVLEYLKSCTGGQVETESWVITSYEVDLGHRIGFGGFGQVYEGIWDKTHVAIKVLNSHSGHAPSSTAIRKEIETWLTLRHTHVLQFLGANYLEDRPFIVMPYLKNGNARDYVGHNPQCNRLRIVRHAALGLLHLHTHRVVHGDIKALNILIDDAGNAVLCDFGLSRIKADVSSDMANNMDKVEVIGSRNWMAPERLLGGTLRKPSDIYALGMTIYEIFTGEVPLAHFVYEDLFELVVRQNVRPEKPDKDTAPTLTDAIWKLAQQCWLKDPQLRPTAHTVCDIISRLPEPTNIIESPPYTPIDHHADKDVAEEVKFQDFSASDITIALMGPRASGKSTFIDVATEGSGKCYRDDPRPFTSAIRSVKFLDPHSGRHIVLVETPGFDDTYTSDSEVLKVIADWLQEAYKRSILLAGVIYLHRISDCRMIGAQAKNLRIFSALCGNDAIRNAVLATTMWSAAKSGMEERREAELREKYWKEMKKNGCSITRFQNTSKSAWEIIGKIAGNQPRPLLIQKEMADGHCLGKTGAGSTLCSILQELLKDQQDAIRGLRGKAGPRNNEQEELIKHYQKVENNIRRQIDEMNNPHLKRNRSTDEVRM